MSLRPEDVGPTALEIGARLVDSGLTEQFIKPSTTETDVAERGCFGCSGAKLRLRSVVMLS